MKGFLAAYWMYCPDFEMPLSRYLSNIEGEQMHVSTRDHLDIFIGHMMEGSSVVPPMCHTTQW